MGWLQVVQESLHLVGELIPVIKARRAKKRAAAAAAVAAQVIKTVDLRVRSMEAAARAKLAAEAAAAAAKHRS